jgi:undecaprenyl-diphosphatase
MTIMSMKYVWIPLYAFVLFLIYKKYEFKKTLILILFFILIIVLSDQSSVHFFKNVFQRLRPCYNPDIESIVHTVKLPGGRFGFVSSHASNAFSFAFLSQFLLKNRIYTIVIFIWACIVSYSRIYLGVHYPGDILGGALLAFILYMPVKNIILNTVLKKVNPSV